MLSNSLLFQRVDISKNHYFSGQRDAIEIPVHRDVDGPPVGPSHFTEAVILSPDANHYSGTFTLDAYDTSGNIATSFTGLLTGTRITINTKATDLF